MNNFLNIDYWKTMPNRDMVLEKIYDFVKALSIKEKGHEFREVYIKEIDKLRVLLDDSLKKYLSLSLEDEEWSSFENKDLSYELDNPFEMDEDLVLPEFSGKQYLLVKDETVSIKLSLRGYITSIRLHFMLAEADELFYLRLSKLTSE
jgi:hypothetical protein